MPKYITPSRTSGSRWQGTAVAGSRFTVEQQEIACQMQGQMAENQRKYCLPSEHDAIALERPARFGEAGPIRRIPRLVLRSNRERDQLQVITPSGELAWITWRK